MITNVNRIAFATTRTVMFAAASGVLCVAENEIALWVALSAIHAGLEIGSFVAWPTSHVNRRSDGRAAWGLLAVPSVLFWSGFMAADVYYDRVEVAASIGRTPSFDVALVALESVHG